MIFQKLISFLMQFLIIELSWVYSTKETKNKFVKNNPTKIDNLD